MMIMGNVRKLSVIGLLALAGATSGCIIDSSNSCSGSAVQTDWTITDAGGNLLSCAAAGASFVDFYVDYYETGPYVAEVGAGECAGE